MIEAIVTALSLAIVIFLGGLLFAKGRRKEMAGYAVASFLALMFLTPMIDMESGEVSGAVFGDNPCRTDLKDCDTVYDFKTYSPVFAHGVEACKAATEAKVADYANEGYRGTTGELQFGGDAFETLVHTENWAATQRQGGVTMKDEHLYLETSAGWRQAQSGCMWNWDAEEARASVGYD